MKITEVREAGFIRFEINTARIDLCRAQIERTPYIASKEVAEGVVNYVAEYKSSPLNIMTTDTRVVIWGTNRQAMTAFLKAIEGDEKLGTAWAYDDAKRSDYQNKK